jgi:integrase
MPKDSHFRFTKKALLALPAPPKGKRAYYYDSGARGLCLSITPAGTRTFYVYRWLQGKPERVMLGRFPDLSLEKARGKAGEVNSQIAEGKNPQDTRRALKGEPTLAWLFQEFKERHLVPHRKSKTIQDYEWQFGKHLGHWKNRKLTAIQRKDVQKLHVKLGKQSGHYMANRVLALLSAMYGKAISWGLWEGENPAKGIERFKEKSRERFIQKDELPRFFEALALEPNTTARDCILLCLLTGARRSNVQSMRWKDLELDMAVWTIPDTKSGEKLTVPLVPMAIEILRSREDTESDWVFPGSGKTGHLVELKNVWARITRVAELEDLRLHDLRRTLGSWQAITGASLTVIGKSLGHKNVSTTAIYSRLSEDPVREAMERAVDAILATRVTKDESKVRSLVQ